MQLSFRFLKGCLQKDIGVYQCKLLEVTATLHYERLDRRSDYRAIRNC